MAAIDYDSPAALKQYLDENGMAMQKKFGQNFLINAQARRRLVDALELSPGMKVWEVGPGLGSMTSMILADGANLTAFEIDRGFASCLREELSQYMQSGHETFRLVEGDVLKTWKGEWKESGIPERFFGNLPYNVAAAIVADMISAGVRFDQAVITVQKEVAQRITAKPGDEDYSSFSVLCQWAYDVSNIIDLAGGSFWPRPNVDSRAVKMVKKEAFPCCRNPALFMKLVRALFAQRRKTIKNNLNALPEVKGHTDWFLEKAGLAPNLRAEVLSVNQMLSLSDVIEEGYVE